ncbi:hypothetical protein B0H14DRAFT_951375 [Mycena olivaceomarginata]|nr:hypothetical protein B0H14DRAFT_951375 [Mycena olivaceomarginata]
MEELTDLIEFRIFKIENPPKLNQMNLVNTEPQPNSPTELEYTYRSCSMPMGVLHLRLWDPPPTLENCRSVSCRSSLTFPGRTIIPPDRDPSRYPYPNAEASFTQGFQRILAIGRTYLWLFKNEPDPAMPFRENPTFGVGLSLRSRSPLLRIRPGLCGCVEVADSVPDQMPDSLRSTVRATWATLKATGSLLHQFAAFASRNSNEEISTTGSGSVGSWTTCSSASVSRAGAVPPPLIIPDTT